MKSAGRTILLRLWAETLDEVSPGRLLPPSASAPEPDRARLFWGKAAQACWRARRSGCPTLVISPEPRPATLPLWQTGPLIWVRGGHPLPDEGSFAAGRSLLEFFDDLRRRGIRKLEVDLSGGASSLAWLRPHGISEPALRKRLEDLYRRPHSIRALNRERSRLCLLKGGGSSRILRLIAPQVAARVCLISDVAPYGAEVVGSGPFFDGLTPHSILADNGSLCRAWARSGRLAGVEVLIERQAWIAPWQEWVKVASRSVRARLSARRESWILLGGEPLLGLPKAGLARRGGRQSHLALALALELENELRQGRLDLLCLASDGRDGNSGSSGAWITRESLPPTGFQAAASRALHDFASAEFLARRHALLEERPSCTNVQDVLLVRIRAASS